MSTVTVWHLNDDRFAIEMRDHVITVDQPLADGGQDTAPAPSELFVASLAACIGHYTRRYLARHDLPTAGLSVTADYTIGGRPARVSDIRVTLRIPEDVPAHRRDALLAVASHCTVHNTLVEPPAITITLDAPAEVAAEA
jgi:putative redox protein